MLVIKYGTTNSNTCKALNLSDLTGSYNASTNKGGYGTPNQAVGDFNAATFTIEGGGINATVNLYNTLPTASSSILFPITNVDLGLAANEPIPSAIYLGTYELNETATDDKFTDSHYFFASCLAYCCLDTFISQLNGNCGCDDKQRQELVMKIMDISATIMAIEEAIAPSCNQIGRASELVEYLNNLCASCEGCGCN